MSKYTDKLNSLKIQVIAKVNATVVSPTQTDNRPMAREWYTGQFNNLISAVNSYTEDGKSVMETDMNDIITIGVSYLTMTYGKPEEEIFNLWGYYGGSGILQEILSWNASQLFIGINQLSGDHPILAPATLALRNAKSEEHSARENFHGILMNRYMPGSLKAMFEEIPVFDENNEPPKIKECAKRIYNDWKAKEIIREFGLNVYIPTYID